MTRAPLNAEKPRLPVKRDPPGMRQSVGANACEHRLCPAAEQLFGHERPCRWHESHTALHHGNTFFPNELNRCEPRDSGAPLPFLMMLDVRQTVCPESGS